MTTEDSYHSQDLRGQSFQGADLDGADFTEADVRGADFTDASLVAADFTSARIGVRPVAAALILVGALMVSVAAGRAHGGIAAIVVSMPLVFISRRALKADERDRPLRYVAHRIVTHRGTRFAEADVTRATFAGTTLTHSDTSGAVLDDAVWEPGRGPLVLDND
jgi:uncharacterized protein YjbI with pentapeptide repeats